MTIYRNTRRTFLKQGAICAVGAVGAATPVFGMLRRPANATSLVPQQPVLDDPDTKALVQKAIDAAMAGGASYADVRLTHTRTRNIQGSVSDSEEVTAGVRALANGYWGFASSPVWSGDEMARLGQQAALQAKTIGLNDPYERELAPTAPIANGQWKMPVQIDPFDVPVAEIMDFLSSLNQYSRRVPGFTGGTSGFWCTTVVQAFGASVGSYCTQQRYLSGGAAGVNFHTGNSAPVNILTSAGVGWELFRGQPVHEALQAAIEEVLLDESLPMNPVDIGRYETVFDSWSVGLLLNGTIGSATELDRAMGYEANAGGTSYITDPIGMLGTLQIGSPLLQVTGNRNVAGGAATVQWDDEGVVPSPFTIIKDGKLQDVSTTRESAMWLRDRYTALGRPVQSNGCAFAPSGLSAPISMTPNLEMAPGKDSTDFETLIKGMKSGIAFTRLTVHMDFQQLNGFGNGGTLGGGARAYEIKNGKRVSRIQNAGFLFRSPEFWKSMTAIGGQASAQRYGVSSTKGEPPQQSWRSITAVPMVCKDISVIDIKRKA